MRTATALKLGLLALLASACSKAPPPAPVDRAPQAPVAVAPGPAPAAAPVTTSTTPSASPVVAKTPGTWKAIVRDQRGHVVASTEFDVRAG